MLVQRIRKRIQRSGRQISAAMSVLAMRSGRQISAAMSVLAMQQYLQSGSGSSDVRERAKAAAVALTTSEVAFDTRGAIERCSMRIETLRWRITSIDLEHLDAWT